VVAVVAVVAAVWNCWQPWRFRGQMLLALLTEMRLAAGGPLMEASAAVGTCARGPQALQTEKGWTCFCLS